MRHRVLVADDEIAEVLVDGLKPHADLHGIQLFAAHDGAECLRMAEKTRPDLIVLDVKLPVVDGFEVLEQLRRRMIVTRIIMMSGVATDMETAIRCVRAGACDYILKKTPFDLEKFLERIRRNLLLENTTNVSLSDLSPIQQDLVNEAARLKEDLEQLRTEHASLLDGARQQKTRVFNEVLLKAGLVGLALTGIGVLWAIGFNEPSQLAWVFVIVLLILIIPADKIQSLSTNVLKLFNAKLVLRDPGGAERTGKLATDADESSQVDAGIERSG